MARTQPLYMPHEPVACADTCRPVPLLAVGGYVEISSIPLYQDSLAFHLEPSDSHIILQQQR